MAASARDFSIPVATKAGRTYGVRRPEELFSRDGPLGARADVRVLTSDGQVLWLHRVVLEMWSSLFHDLIAASEESFDGSSESLPVTISLTDTAADLMLLLSFLYPASCHSERPHGSTLDTPSFLPLLGLADKYHCPHIIHRCSAFATDHILPRLATCTRPEEAAHYLQLPLPPVTASEAAATGAREQVVEWVVRCLELAVRLELDELAESTAALFGQRFFDWQLQADAHRDHLTRVARILPPEQFVDHVLRAIPPPPLPCDAAAAAAASSVTKSGNGSAAVRAAAAAVGGRNAGAAAGAPGAGAGLRIVPVVVAAAGPAAAVAQHAPVPAAPPLVPAAAGPGGQEPLLVAGAAGAPGLAAAAAQPFQAQQQLQQHHDDHHQQQNLHPMPHGFWHGAAAQFPVMAVNGNGAVVGLPVQPEPFLGPGGPGW